MGKKKIIAQNQEELIKEREKVDAKLQKEVEIAPRQRITEGRVYIFSSYNNTIINIADSKGNVLTWASAGAIGFKGAKKSTPFAASKVAETLADRAKKIGIERVKVFVRGIGSGRESAIRSLAARGMEIDSIKDITPIPHNGCRPRKPRRV
ncbi:MAG: 30S ribosomal protein S11 [bacterium]|nr:30S ribosomal protein S11 [bacterium]